VVKDLVTNSPVIIKDSIISHIAKVTIIKVLIIKAFKINHIKIKDIVANKVTRTKVLTKDFIKTLLITKASTTNPQTKISLTFQFLMNSKWYRNC